MKKTISKALKREWDIFLIKYTEPYIRNMDIKNYVVGFGNQINRFVIMLK